MYTSDIATFHCQALCHRDMSLQGMLGSGSGRRGYFNKDTEAFSCITYVVICSYMTVNKIISINTCFDRLAREAKRHL